MFQWLSGKRRRGAPAPAAAAAAPKKRGRPTRAAQEARDRERLAELQTRMRLLEAQQKYRNLRKTGRAAPVTVAEARELLESQGFVVAAKSAEEAGGGGTLHEIAQMVRNADKIAPLLAMAMGASPEQIAALAAASREAEPPAQPALRAGGPSGQPAAKGHPAAAQQAAPPPKPATPAGDAAGGAEVPEMDSISAYLLANLPNMGSAEAAAWLREPGQPAIVQSAVRQLVTVPDPLLPHALAMLRTQAGWDEVADWLRVNEAWTRATVAELKRLAEQPVPNGQAHPAPAQG